MRAFLLTLAVLVSLSASLGAQTATEKKTYQMFSTNFMKPKQGHVKAFEDAVKAHNAKYHPAGPYEARLSEITAGSGSDGWYVWAMGPHTYTDLDGEPSGNKAHDDDWDKTIDIHVEQYGESNYWKLQEDLSYTPANYKPPMIDVWSIDIKMGERYRFEELMKKWKGLYDAKKYDWAMRVFYNDLWSGDGNDAAIIFSFNKYADIDIDVKFREDFEAMYGAGSWANFWNEWRDCVVR